LFSIALPSNSLFHIAIRDRLIEEEIMVELRKRPAPPAAPPPKAKKAATNKAKGKKVDAPKETKPPPSNPAKDAKGGIPEGAGGVSGTAEIDSSAEAQKVAAKVEADAVKGAGKKGGAKVGDTITVEGFGGEIETNDGVKTSLAKLLDESKAGVVLFTYPKASTPGCEFAPATKFARGRNRID